MIYNFKIPADIVRRQAEEQALTYRDRALTLAEELSSQLTHTETALTLIDHLMSGEVTVPVTEATEILGAYVSKGFGFTTHMDSSREHFQITIPGKTFFEPQTTVTIGGVVEDEVNNVYEATLSIAEVTPLLARHDVDWEDIIDSLSSQAELLRFEYEAVISTLGDRLEPAGLFSRYANTTNPSVSYLMDVMSVSTSSGDPRGLLEAIKSAYTTVAEVADGQFVNGSFAMSKFETSQTSGFLEGLFPMVLDFLTTAGTVIAQVVPSIIVKTVSAVVAIGASLLKFGIQALAGFINDVPMFTDTEVEDTLYGGYNPTYQVPRTEAGYYSSPFGVIYVEDGDPGFSRVSVALRTGINIGESYSYLGGTTLTATPAGRIPCLSRDLGIGLTEDQAHTDYSERIFLAINPSIQGNPAGTFFINGHDFSISGTDQAESYKTLGRVAMGYAASAITWLALYCMSRASGMGFDDQMQNAIETLSSLEFEAYGLLGGSQGNVSVWDVYAALESWDTTPNAPMSEEWSEFFQNWINIQNLVETCLDYMFSSTGSIYALTQPASFDSGSSFNYVGYWAKAPFVPVQWEARIIPPEKTAVAAFFGRLAAVVGVAAASVLIARHGRKLYNAYTSIVTRRFRNYQNALNAYNSDPTVANTNALNTAKLRLDRANGRGKTAVSAISSYLGGTEGTAALDAGLLNQVITEIILLIQGPTPVETVQED